MNYKRRKSFSKTWIQWLISSNHLKTSNGIKETQNIILCIYGPTGNSKSAYAKYLGKELDKEVHIKKK